jgi:signal transduction histidine kinase
VIAGGLAIRRSAPSSVAVDVLAWLYVLGLPALALAFAVAFVRVRFSMSGALAGLALRLQRMREPDDLRDVLASTLGDPSLEIGYWIGDSPERWVDAAGNEMSVLQAGRSTTFVNERGRRVAAFVHDPALGEQWRFVEAAGAFALAALEIRRLRVRVDASLTSLAQSRARIQAVADNERRRIERDLHDGAQQRLVALRVRLELAAEDAQRDPARSPALLRQVGGEVEEVLDEVRALARGVYPSALVDRGLEQALRQASRRMPVPTSFEADELGRYSSEIEAAIYFCCLEALQNLAKHADGATFARISVADSGSLRFEVQDDGCGFDVDAVAAGAGLTNMRDRIDAVGGELTVESTPGAGTRIVGAVPLG